MSRLFCLFFLALLPVVALNVYVDPAHLIKSGARGLDEFTIARIVLEGKNAVVRKDRIGFDERLTRRIIFERKKKTDNSVIFGSSRVRYFSGAAFNELSHFVDATNAATLEDLLVFTYLRAKYNLLPKRLVIALDPWMIERENSYTRLVQLSYPDAFAQAVEHLGVSLPQGSQRIYNTASMPTRISVPFASTTRDTPSTGNSNKFQRVMTGTSGLSGEVQVSFDAMIEAGTYYWAWRVLLNDHIVDSGSYMDNLQHSPSPHEFRTILTKSLTVKHGDKISVELAHATGAGVAELKGSQQYQVRNFVIEIKCGDPAAKDFKEKGDCARSLARGAINTAVTIGNEMISPAYFQQSLKTLLGKLSASTIMAKSGCTPEPLPTTWVVCDDGSLPWPDRASYDSAKVESIVRTVDDKLVPLQNVDENSLKLLGQITNYYRAKGTVVKYLLVPVHPFSYSKWAAENDSRGFLKAEKVFRDFAKENGVTIAGSYDPNVIGCKNTDFRDWVHPLPRCTNLLAQELMRPANLRR